jgi:hypothetical protein
MRQPTELPQRGWMPYVRVLEGAHESGWGLFEVGYVDGNGSRIVLSRKADVVLIEPPGVGKIAIDHDCGSTEVRFGEHDNKGLWPYWLDTKYSTAELGWTEHAPRFAFVQRIANDPAGSQEENPPDRVPFRPQVFDGETAAREAQRFERTSVDGTDPHQGTP